jgi:tellurite resistance protein TerC
MSVVHGDGGDVPKGSLAKRIGIAVVGGTVTLIGIALIVLPGPAIVVIPIGLSILATEFLWARRYLRTARDMATRLKRKAAHALQPDRPADAAS